MLEFVSVIRINDLLTIDIRSVGFCSDVIVFNGSIKRPPDRRQWIDQRQRLGVDCAINGPRLGSVGRGLVFLLGAVQRRLVGGVPDRPGYGTVRVDQSSVVGLIGRCRVAPVGVRLVNRQTGREEPERG